MSAEYSYVPVQTAVAENENILFLDGERACRKGFIKHRDTSGVFRLKSANNTCKTIYRVTFDANIAVSATGGTAGPISVALQEDGETLGNAIATVTAAVGEFNNVSISTFIVVEHGCCKSVSFKNVSDGTAIDVSNANVIFDRIA